MTFEKFYYLNEAKFSDSPDHIKEMDIPMFTLYVDRNIYTSDKNFRLYIEMAEDLLKEAFSTARRRISKLGFPSMHANVILEDYSQIENGNVNSLGYAMGNPRKSTTNRYQQSRYMSLNYRIIFGLLNDDIKYMPILVNTIVHEWAHLWMFNYGRRLSTAVQKFYDNIINSQENILISHMMNKDFEKDYIVLMKSINQLGRLSIQKGKSNIEKLNELFDTFEKKYNIPSFQFRDIKKEIQYELQQAVKGQHLSVWNQYIDQLDLKSTFEGIYKTSIMMSGLSGNKNAWDNKLADIIQWSRGYGMKNIDELWATGVEDFSKLPREHQRRILALMSEEY